MDFAGAIVREPESAAFAGRPELALAQTSATVEFEIVSARAGFERLQADWTALAGRSSLPAQPFLGFNWNWHWANHYLGEPGSTLAIVVGRHEGSVVMIWPLLQSRLLSLRVIAFMGAPVSQYGDVLVDRADPRHESWLRQGWTFVIRDLRPDLVLLRKVRDDSAIVGLMRRLEVAKTNKQRAPYIDLSNETDYASFELRFSAKDRKNRRRKRRRMEEAGTVACRHIVEPAERGASLELAMRRKRDWLAGEGLLSAAVTDPRFDAFFRDATSANRPAPCDVVELSVGGHPVATKIALNAGRYRGLHFTAYDKAAEKFSPGILMLESMIAEAIADGVATFDFMAPAADYKLEWTDRSVGVADYAVPFGLMGRLYQIAYLDCVRPRLQRLSARGPAPVRRVIQGVLQLMMSRGDSRRRRPA